MAPSMAAPLHVTLLEHSLHQQNTSCLHSFVLDSTCQTLDVLFWLACHLSLAFFNIFISLIIQKLVNNLSKIFHHFDWRLFSYLRTLYIPPPTHTYITFNPDKNSRISEKNICLTKILKDYFSCFLIKVLLFYPYIKVYEPFWIKFCVWYEVSI